MENLIKKIEAAGYVLRKDEADPGADFKFIVITNKNGDEFTIPFKDQECRLKDANITTTTHELYKAFYKWSEEEYIRKAHRMSKENYILRQKILEKVGFVEEEYSLSFEDIKNFEVEKHFSDYERVGSLKVRNHSKNPKITHRNRGVAVARKTGDTSVYWFNGRVDVDKWEITKTLLEGLNYVAPHFGEESKLCDIGTKEILEDILLSLELDCETKYKLDLLQSRLSGGWSWTLDWVENKGSYTRERYYLMKLANAERLNKEKEERLNGTYVEPKDPFEDLLGL